MADEARGGERCSPRWGLRRNGNSRQQRKIVNTRASSSSVTFIENGTSEIVSTSQLQLRGGTKGYYIGKVGCYPASYSYSYSIDAYEL